MINSQETLNVLQNSPLFRGVSHKMIQQKLSDATHFRLNAGEILLEAGQPNHLLYVILSGRLSVHHKAVNVEPTAMLGEGECVGEMSILGDTNFSAYVVAATDCVLFAIEQSVLWKILDGSHKVAHNMLGILAARIRVADNALAESREFHHGFSAHSIVDELTGLYNRNWMMIKFDRHMRRSISGKKSSCLMVLEIDQFEEYGASFGLLGSDQALRDLAYLILSSLRPDDQAGHSQDDQFAVFMPNTTLSEAGIAAMRLRAAVNQSMVVLPSGDALPSFKISIGITQVRQEDVLSDLFSRAEQALQQAKSKGGDCSVSVE